MRNNFHQKGRLSSLHLIADKGIVDDPVKFLIRILQPCKSIFTYDSQIGLLLDVQLIQPELFLRKINHSL